MYREQYSYRKLPQKTRKRHQTAIYYSNMEYPVVVNAGVTSFPLRYDEGKIINRMFHKPGNIS